MGSEQPAKYYDDIFESSPAYAVAPHLTPWAHIWWEVDMLIERDARVLDLGCGPGHLGEWLAPSVASYMGVDFSSIAISQARSRCAHFPHVQFRVGDLREVWGDAEYDVVVCCEVLEHIEADLEIVARVPSDMRMIFTVPDFDDAGHVRHFADVEQVQARYSHLFTSLDVTKVERHYICEGKRA